MNKNTEYPEIQELIFQYLSDVEDDYIGLWETIGDIENINAPSPLSEDFMMEEVLKVVYAMLHNGFMPVYLAAGGKCIAWLENDKEEILRTIKNKWYKLGRKPNIGDIVYFDRTSS